MQLHILTVTHSNNDITSAHTNLWLYIMHMHALLGYETLITIK